MKSVEDDIILLVIGNWSLFGVLVLLVIGYSLDQLVQLEIRNL